MKGFIAILFTIGVAAAAPQYAYGPPNHQHQFGSGSLISSGSSFGNIGNQGGGASGGSLSGISSSQIGGSSNGQLGGNFASQQNGPQNFGGFSANNFGVSKQVVEQSAPQQPIVTKQFFIHSAPEEQEEIGGDKVINLGPGRKHYRVVFIKAPHQNIQGGKVRFVAPANEEKTVIYVLSKKTDLADIAADVQQAQAQPTKPEVHFIKYKTPEEAAHAQRTIQAQYDQLDGTSQVSDEGIAPVQSVIGILGDSSNNNVDEASAGQIAQSSDGSFTSGGSNVGGNLFGTSSSGINNNNLAVDNGAVSYLPPSY